MVKKGVGKLNRTSNKLNSDNNKKTTLFTHTKKKMSVVKTKSKSCSISTRQTKQKKKTTHISVTQKKKLTAGLKNKHSKNKHTRTHKVKPLRQVQKKPEEFKERIFPPPHEVYDDYYLPSPIHIGKYKIPGGIRFLIGYLTFLAVLYVISFIFGITFPTSILFGKLITGARAMFVNSILLILILVIIYGFYTRKSYSFDFSIGFFFFSAVNAFISLVLFDSAEHPVFKKMLLLSFVSLIIMDSVIIWYLYHERKFFYVERFRDRPWHHRDKLFLYVLVTFWIVTILIGIVLGVWFYKDTTRLIDTTITELKGSYYYGTEICDSKQGSEKDVCFLVLATVIHQKNVSINTEPYCEKLESDFYRFTCKRSINA